MSKIVDLRREIDKVDQQILRFLANRIKVCQAIGAAKKAKGLPIKDVTREKEIYQRIRQQATNLGLDPVKVESIYREIVNMCISVQE